MGNSAVYETHRANYKQYTEIRARCSAILVSAETKHKILFLEFYK